MSLGGSTSSGQQQSSTFYDPAQVGLVDNYAQGVQAAANGALAYQPYSGQSLSFGDSAPLTSLTGYQAPTVSAGQLSDTNLSPYTNPYEQSVVDATSSQLARQNQIDNTNAAAQATAAGAFGGSRSAVLQNLDTDSYQRNLDQTLAGLNQANYTQAQQAAQSDIAGNLQAQQSNQQAATSAAQARLSALGLTAQEAEQLYGANWQQYLNQQQYPLSLQQLVTQAYGLVPAGPLSESSGSQSSDSIKIGIPISFSNSSGSQ
jgi:hypothetical protein